MIDPYYVIKGGNAEIIHLCEEYSLFEFSESSLEYADQYMHRDILQWLNETKNIDYQDDLTEVDYLPNSSFIHYILNADNYKYNLSAMIFYSIERNYPLFVIKYLVQLGAKNDFVFYRGPPFEVEENSLDKAIEMKRIDVIDYLESFGMKPINYYNSDYHQIQEATEKHETIKSSKNEYTKLWHEKEFKENNYQNKDELYAEDAYETRYLIDHYNFCGLQFDTVEYDCNFNRSFFFDLNKNIKYMERKGLINKEGKSPYDYQFNGLSQFVSFEEAWIYCEQAFDLYRKGKNENNDELCKLGRDHIIDKMNDRMIEHDYYGKGIWKYFLNLMK